MLYLWLLLVVSTSVFIDGASVHRQKRCRTTDDLGRIPWFSPNTTFHNLGFPLVRTLCNTTSPGDVSYNRLGCVNASSIAYLYESERDLRSGPSSSTIIVDPHMMQGPNAASSGSYVIMAMFEILLDLEYQPGVRHWSEPMNGMFPPHVTAAAMKISRQYDSFTRGVGANPYATTPNFVMFQIEVPFGFKISIPVNTSPYHRTFQWMIGLIHSHQHAMYQFSDSTSHCTGANFFLGGGHMCTTSEVISCPQYDFHRTRSLEVTPENRNTTKKNIILFDNDQEEIDMERLKVDVMKLGGLDDLQVLRNEGRKRVDMPDLYKQIKMAIDCRNPGVEFINYEATLYDTMTLACDMRATRNVFDFPVPSQYHINHRNWTQLVKLVHSLMINYEERIDDFKHFKRLSRTSSQLARTQVDIHYFSRDVLFRTHCGSYPECRRVYPWAVAVWTLYPMAMIEVVTDMDLYEESLESDVVRNTAAGLFSPKYFKIYNSAPGMAPVDMFPRTPCTYMVYMDASFIPFGRDFLNTHVAALVKDPRPIVYYQGEKLAIAVMHARPYVKLFRDGAGKAQITYVERNYIIRAVENSNVTAALSSVFGAPVAVESGYRTKLAEGEEPFTQESLGRMLRRNPPLQSRPCDDTVVVVAPVKPAVVTPNTTTAAPAAAPAAPAPPAPPDAVAVNSTSEMTTANSTAISATNITETQSLRRRVTTVTSAASSHIRHNYTARPHVPYVRHSTIQPREPARLAAQSGANPNILPQTQFRGPTPHPGPQLHIHHQNTRSYGAARPRCVPKEHLIIDAIYVPMPLVHDNTENSPHFLTEPTLWLTSSLPPVPFHTVFDTFDKKQIEIIVQHLDPILQNSYMRKIVSLIPSDIADAFKMFDAIDYPNVISLRDMEYPHWGEKC